MSALRAVVFGIVQGLTEFLPISSSGHLVLLPWLFGWDDLADASMERAFSVALHLGTLIGLVAYLSRDLLQLARAGWAVVIRPSSHDPHPESRLLGYLAIGTIPAAVVGFVLESVFGDAVPPVPVTAGMLVVFGLVLYVADRRPEQHDLQHLSAAKALLVGTAQALALIPGVSRSGSTIAAGRFLGLDRATAARFSFLLAVPITVGAVIYESVDVFVTGDGIPEALRGAFVWGTLSSAVTGFVAIAALLRIIRRVSYRPFVFYRVVVGLGFLALAAVRAG